MKPRQKSNTLSTENYPSNTSGASLYISPAPHLSVFILLDEQLRQASTAEIVVIALLAVVIAALVIAVAVVAVLEVWLLL